MPLNKTMVGRMYEPVTFEVTAEGTKNFALAYNEDNPWFLDEKRPGGIIAPPMFGVVYSFDAMGKPMGDPALGVDPEMVLRLVHGEEDLTFIRPVRPGDRITTIPFIERIEEKTTGETIVIGMISKNQKGEEVQRGLATIFIRGRAGKKEQKPPEPEPQRMIVVEKTQKIDNDQTYRYADASGDHNPIHIDENVAKMAGFPTVIVHGLCTMSFTSKVMIDELCKGDPTKLKRLRARFSKPVLPGQAITTKVWKESESVFGFETYNPDGAAVVKNGLCETIA